LVAILKLTTVQPEEEGDGDGDGVAGAELVLEEVDDSDP
jgi:hypothetical protein